MKNYRVVWQIDIEANSPEEAAREALEIQRDIDSEALIFVVDGEMIDLLEQIED